MGLEFLPVETPSQIDELADMANRIWHEYWPDIIGKDQTDYMIDMFQSVSAITRDIQQHNYRYWFVVDDGKKVGFTGGAIEEMTDDADHNAFIHHSDVVDTRWPRRFFISKVYLYADERGKHYSSRVLDFYEQFCRNNNLPVMYLTVNRENDLGVRAYKGRGFDTVDQVDNPIGRGYVMNDYIMAKEIAPVQA